MRLILTKFLPRMVWKCLLRLIQNFFVPSLFLARMVTIGSTIHNQRLKTTYIIFKGNDKISKPIRTTIEPAETLATMIAILFTSIILSLLSPVNVNLEL